MTIEVRRIFEIYVDELVADQEAVDELLLIRLRYFQEDVSKVIDRLGENPRLVVELVQHLSTRMQELDTSAGESDHAKRAVAKARSLALLLPETAIHDDADSPDVHANWLKKGGPDGGQDDDAARHDLG